MQKDPPIWYKLIHYWCRQRIPTGYGLTLPFIVGAIDNMTISKLLIEIRESKLDEKIILRECSDLKEYVLSFDDDTNSVAQFLSGEKGLLYDDEKLESLNSFEEISKYLEHRYSSFIADKTYSKNKLTNIWEKYSQENKDTIHKVLSQ
jgi:uncharacterized protein YozE (UPF0346 family)